MILRPHSAFLSLEEEAGRRILEQEESVSLLAWFS